MKNSTDAYRWGSMNLSRWDFKRIIAGRQHRLPPSLKSESFDFLMDTEATPSEAMIRWVESQVKEIEQERSES